MNDDEDFALRNTHFLGQLKIFSVLVQLIFLEHGAHYAIGALGGLMLAGIWLKEQHSHLPTAQRV